MVTLTIDGIEVTVERGTSILEAAQKAGIRIPTLCHDKRLIPFGACRLCVVEVTQRGRTRTMPACFNPVRDGMEVATHTPKLIESRRMQLMLLLRSHPLLCPSCDAAGACQLQNLVHEYEITDLPFSRETRYYHVDNDSHFIRHNMNLCIRCGMCVRICDEVQGQNELSFVNRGMNSEISTDFGRPLDCEFCGQCASICPVGAISSKWLVGTGREFELKKSDTTCAFCSLGCTLTLGRKNEKIVYVTSPPDSVNEGNLCVKGRYGWPYVYSEQRLVKPLIRKEGELKQVEWNEALNFVAEKFKSIKAASGPLSIAALGSERLTNEEAYVFNRFVRTVLETPHLDHSGGYSYKGLVEAAEKSLGYPAGTNAIREIRKAKIILLFGADLTETHPVAKNEVILASGRNRAKVVVVDSIRTKLTERRPGVFINVPPYTEYIVANSMLKHILDEGIFDKTALDLRVEGLEELKASLEGYEPEKVGALLGIDAETIKNVSAEYATTPNSTIILTQGMNRLGGNVELMKAAINLALVTGHLGKEAAGVHIFGEKANAQGAIDMGLVPDLLPGFCSLSDEAARAKFEEAWQSPLPAQSGLSAREILSKAEAGEIKALYVVGENPLDTYPDRDKVEKALANLEFLVVQDLFATSTAKMAHAVLPVVTFAEKSGTFTSAERRVQLIKPAVRIKPNKSDLEIFIALAALMGKPAMTYTGPEQVMDEIASLVDVYRGISYERLRNNGIAWPCVDSEDPGKTMLYEGGFPRGKAVLLPASPIRAPQPANGLMYLIPGILKFHSGAFSVWSDSLKEVSPESYVEMSYSDVKTLGLREGDFVKITKPGGASIQAKIKPSRRAVNGFIIVPYHFPEQKLNKLTCWDEPMIKVQIEKVTT